MAVIANLAVSLTARTAAFSQRMRRARKDVQGFGGAVRQVAGAATSFGAKLTALVAGGSFVALIRSAMTSADELGKTADKLGLGSEALAGFHHAGSLAGVEIEQFNTGLQMMTRNVSEAAMGIGEAQAAFAALGLSAAQMHSLSADQQFLAIADAMQQVGNQGDRVQLAMRMFGRSGAGMLNVMRGGSAALAETAAEADALGLSLSRVDIAQIEAANDAFTRMTAMVRGAANVIAVQLAPFLEHAARSLIATGTAGRGLADRILSGFEAVLSAVAKLSDWLELLKAVWHGLRATAAAALMVIAQAVAGISGLIDKVLARLGVELAPEFTQFVSDFADGLEAEAEASGLAMNEAIARFVDSAAQKEVTQFFDDVRQKAHQAAEAIVAIPPMLGPDLLAFTAGGKLTKGVDEATKHFDKLQSDAQRMLSSVRTPLEVLNDEMNKIGELRFHQLIDDAQFDRLADAAREAYRRAIGGDQELASGMFAQASLLRNAIAGVNVPGLATPTQKTQTVTDPDAVKELKASNLILSQIERRMSSGGSVATAA